MRLSAVDSHFHKFGYRLHRLAPPMTLAPRNCILLLFYPSVPLCRNGLENEEI
jgi:hypothetical protein